MSKRKDVSLLVSAAGWIAGFVDQLVRALREQGVSDEEIHGLVTGHGNEWIARIADELAKIARQAKNIFYLKIGGKRTTEEAVKAGNYDWSNSDINNRNFPMRPRPTGERIIELIEFDYNPTSEQVLAEAEKRGGLGRPVYEDALDFGEQFPEKQRERPIVFLHKPWQDSYGGRRVLVLGSRNVGRKLDLYFFDREWNRYFLFAFFHK